MKLSISTALFALALSGVKATQDEANPRSLRGLSPRETCCWTLRDLETFPFPSTDDFYNCGITEEEINLWFPDPNNPGLPVTYYTKVSYAPDPWDPEGARTANWLNCRYQNGLAIEARDLYKKKQRKKDEFQSSCVDPLLAKIRSLNLTCS